MTETTPATPPRPPWIDAWVAESIKGHRGHALLAQVPAGSGALAYGLACAQAWLCESPTPSGVACGRCASCRLVAAHTHPDLWVAVPELVAVSAGLPVELDEKRKPSRQIRIDEVRALIDWMMTTSGRGRGKVVVIQPAEAMNAAAASALLKTLEEPPAGARLLLATADASLLLPTVRSRCQHRVLPTVTRDDALGWLRRHQVPAPEVLLDAAGGQPLAALQWHQAGWSAAHWSDLPAAVARGDASGLSEWGVPRVVDALQKLCHDAAVAACGGSPRFFPSSSLPPGVRLEPLLAWHKQLQGVMRHAEHPWSEALLLEALVAEGQQAWS